MDIAALPAIMNAASLKDANETAPEATRRDEEIRAKAKEFEAVFIAEMLSHAGLDKAVSENSGHGGEAFSRMLVEAYAEQLADKGGFGLADQIYRQLKGQSS
ncbi:rod-binding protein [Hyphococcus flavus]|uniref:Rod-binding protein n=1 Tax=Hyphococcus flavus TaxID=1866326 RepID=A0AAE9ZEW0_9PROT|nr:rod-binding protein [Hyphococcus flavus]WDI31548.1 rod-binding protein [Hyphococcus flavus]